MVPPKPIHDLEPELEKKQLCKWKVKFYDMGDALMFHFSNLQPSRYQTEPTHFTRLDSDMFVNMYQQWKSSHMDSQQAHLNFSSPMMIAGVLCFFAASISSAGGIGGGGLFIPILTIVGGLDLKMASGFSAFMVTGGSFANVLCNLFIRGEKNKPSIDFDIALLSEPCMLLGVSIGVICNIVFPEWLITLVFVVFLSWCTFKTCRNGLLCWKLESEVARAKGFGKLENGFGKMGDELVRSEILDEDEAVDSIVAPLLGGHGNCRLGIPWMKLGLLVLIWLSFLTVYLLRGNQNGEGVIMIEPCGMGYWVLSSLQFPLAIIFTIWIQCGKNNLQSPGVECASGFSDKLGFPLMALLAGTLGGVFGIGGGMLISPLLLHVGISPEVTAATCSFMVFFSSTMSTVQYLLLGMEQTEIASTLAIACFVASLVGLMVVQKGIKRYGRASPIVFAVGTVMALSTVLITSDGALRVWRDYMAGKYMGFKDAC